MGRDRQTTSVELRRRNKADIVILKHASSIFRHSSNPVCGFSMTEQLRLCAVSPMENWLGSSMNQIQGWTTVLRILLWCYRARTSDIHPSSQFFVISDLAPSPHHIKFVSKVRGHLCDSRK